MAFTASTSFRSAARSSAGPPLKLCARCAVPAARASKRLISSSSREVDASASVGEVACRCICGGSADRLPSSVCRLAALVSAAASFALRSTSVAAATSAAALICATCISSCCIRAATAADAAAAAADAAFSASFSRSACVSVAERGAVTVVPTRIAQVLRTGQVGGRV